MVHGCYCAGLWVIPTVILQADWQNQPALSKGDLQPSPWGWGVALSLLPPQWPLALGGQHQKQGP